MNVRELIDILEHCDGDMEVEMYVRLGGKLNEVDSWCCGVVDEGGNESFAFHGMIAKPKELAGQTA